MPTYNFRNIETNEVTSEFMKMNELDEFKEKNKNLEVIIFPSNLGDSVRLGIRKIDTGFREVLHKIADNNPKSDLKSKLSRN